MQTRETPGEESVSVCSRRLIALTSTRYGRASPAGEFVFEFVPRDFLCFLIVTDLDPLINYLFWFPAPGRPFPSAARLATSRVGQCIRREKPCHATRTVGR